MAVRDIVLYREGEVALRKRSQPVGHVDRRVSGLVCVPLWVVPK